MNGSWSFHSEKDLLETIEVMLGCMLAKLENTQERQGSRRAR